MDTDKLIKAGEEAFEKMTKLSLNDELASELKWCLESFKNDSNPDGLVDKVKASLTTLKDYKADNPRKVSKKLIEDLEKSLA